MSLLNHSLLLGADAAAAGGYAIERSLRFNSSDSAYLSRTPASAGNRKTWTWAGWVKLGSVGTGNFVLFNAENGTSTGFSNNLWLYLTSNQLYVGDGVSDYLASNNKFRDPSAWYHVVLSVDTTQATASSKMKLYVNGAEITYAIDNRASISTNADTTVNSTFAHYIGRSGLNLGYFDGYFADVFLIDGQALDPTSFGEFDDNGIWQPIAYSGSYATNGFHLDFSDNSTAAALGTDSSGSNDWTVNNISVAAGSGNDSLVDVPTNGSQTDTGVGGEVRGNYCTLNPLDNPGNTLSNGNLDLVGAGNSFHGTRSTLSPSSGKWYFECTVVAEGGETRTGPGLYRSTDDLTGDYGNGTVVVYDYLGTLYVRDESGAGSTWYSTSGSISSGDVFGFAFDLDAAKVWVHQNGTWLNSGNPGAGTGAVVSSLPSGTYFPGGWAYNTSDNLVFNFGQRAFAYNTNRSGFKALCTANLPAPVITKPSTVFDVVTRTFTEATASITSLSFSPDLLWFKRRDGAASHSLFDIVRGTSSRLLSNGTNAELTVTDGVTSFDANGFTLGVDSGEVSINKPSGGSGVVWCWDAGSSTVTNTQGSISSQVRASATAGFSVLTYTGNGTSGATVGHGLGVAPSLIIVKKRSASEDWVVYHSALAADKYLWLNATNAVQTNTNRWNNTAPTSTVFSLGSSNSTNGSGNTFVAYCFAPVAGYSSFGSYTGNGSADGPFVYTGFRPRWIMIKRTDSTFGWYMYDTARDTYNIAGKELLANESSAEVSDSDIDIISNGFKPRRSSSAFNASSGTFIYAAFAESPFQYARAR